MCGIAGFLASRPEVAPDRDAVERMCAGIAHRGPDDDGILVDGPAVLGHRRLSIIDLSPEAAQPMVSEDERIAVVVNGEIYNFQELREELEGKGHRFRSRSDSEVTVHLYEEEGPDFVKRLRGMFALALWDGSEQRLVLARDRFGKKPLFYHMAPGGLYFCSEVQAMAASNIFPRDPDPDAIDAYLALQYVPAPLSAYRGVRKLEPGHVAVCRPGQEPQSSPYFELRYDRIDGRPLPELAAELRRHIEEAVRLRLVSDVPLGAFLSGGIDSSLVVAFMARASDRPVKTFSIGFPSKDHSELDFARKTAEFYATEHHEMVVEPDMVSVVPHLVRHYGEPYGDTSAVPTWYLSEFTRKHVTVALSGDAGDEGFAGYNRYRYARAARMLRRLPAPLPRAISALMGRIPVSSLQPVRDFGRRLMEPEEVRYLGLIAHFPHDDRLALYSHDMAQRYRNDPVARRFRELLEASSAPDAVGRLLDLDVRTYLPDDILVKVDIASMAHALEVRCPLLDQEVMTFAASIPSDMKMKGLSAGKRVLREAVKDLLPPGILQRRKRGFALPIDRWMREDLAPMARDLLLDRTAAGRGLFDPGAVERLLQDHARGESRGLQIWNLVMLEQWFRMYIDGRPA